ncbi:hypothetical protein LshimejAT787_0703720 [Lyophyllum shimeji]|uniref:Secreted protein n=1 Tax=Lyophyllum shimeji TaxID=47721 RepID=A0A9P3PNU0_LYOSH|nr:hypothetical protein LshimejAT787_0703720 [Lyophyllum shimeji]
MSDEGGFFAACCGICCLCGVASLQTWCNQTPWGAGGCCSRDGPSGCCGSCCGDSFNEDSFDKEVQKDLEKTRAPDGSEPGTTQVTQQPAAGHTMTVPTHESQ